jgi:glycosyltransferase involved in cell wall biosynthesis
MELALVSVVVPTFKRPDKVRAALKSIYDQTHPNIEVILVDDNGEGSEYDQATYEVVREFELIFKKFIFVKNEVNMGGGGARNEGIKVASGDYVAFLDDDDQYLPNKLELQLAKFIESTVSELALVYCQVSVFDELSGGNISKTSNYFRGNTVPFKENMTGCIAGTPSMLVKKNVLDEVKGFRDLKSGQDWALMVDILIAGYGVDYLEESLVDVYVAPAGRISNSPEKIESLKGELKDIKDEIAGKIEDKPFRRAIYYNHYFQLASALKFSDKLSAISYYLKAITFRFKPTDAAKFLFGLLFGEKLTTTVRAKLNEN